MGNEVVGFAAKRNVRLSRWTVSQPDPPGKDGITDQGWTRDSVYCRKFERMLCHPSRWTSSGWVDSGVKVSATVVEPPVE